MLVNAHYLKALLHLAAKQDIRYYLNGVLVDATPEHGKLYVATDGHRIGVFHDGWKHDETRERVQIIVPRDILEQMQIFRLAAPSGKVPATLEPASADRWMIDTKCGAALVFRPTDGKFPDWRHIFQKTINGKAGDYNWHLLAGVNECVTVAFGGRNHSVKLWQNGNGVGLITMPGEPEFIGALMPMRMDEKTYKLPDWLLEPETQAA
jgi:DNA polymerase-3 subunit beta